MSMTIVLKHLINEGEVKVSPTPIQICHCCGRKHYYMMGLPLWKLIGKGGKRGGFQSYCPRCAKKLYKRRKRK